MTFKWGSLRHSFAKTCFKNSNNMQHQIWCPWLLSWRPDTSERISNTEERERENETKRTKQASVLGLIESVERICFEIQKPKIQTFNCNQPFWDSKFTRQRSSKAELRIMRGEGGPKPEKGLRNPQHLECEIPQPSRSLANSGRIRAKYLQNPSRKASPFLSHAMENAASNEQQAGRGSKKRMTFIQR